MDFKYSKFPDELDYPSDTTAYLSDLTSDDWENIKLYNQALIDGDTSEAANILKDLKGKHITAEDINKIIDCIRAVEKAYIENTVKNNEVITDGDFNKMTTPGIYTMKSSKNKPTTGNFYGLIVLKSNNRNFIEQIAFKESSYDIYIRTFNNSSWSAWKKINDGGNADTVDGKHANDFIIDYGIVADINDYVNNNKSCIVRWTNTTLNSPYKQGLTGAMTGTVFIYSASTLWSCLIGYSDGHSEVFVKSLAGGTNPTIVTDWKKINDGGNADTVDGKHASDFAPKNHTHNYLPTTGGTINNNLEINGELDLNGTLFVEDITASMDISAKTFSGDGSNLTNVNASELNGKTADDFSLKNHTHILSELLKNENFYSAKEINYSLSNILNNIFVNGFVITTDNYLVYIHFENYVSDGQPDGYYYTTTAYYSYIKDNTLYCQKADLKQFVAGGYDDGRDSFTNNTLLYTNTYDLSTVLKHTHRKSDITDFPTSLPADGGIAAGIKIPNEGAYTTDQYGNFRHNSDNTQNTWNIVSGEGANKFSVNFENGNVSTFGTIKAANFSGDGSDLTNVNASTIMNRNINEIQTRDKGYAFYTSDESYDWNDITNSGYYGLMKTTSAAKHNPVNGKFFFPMVFKYADDTMTQLAVPYTAGNKDDSGLLYIRSKGPTYNGWSDWKAVGSNYQYHKTVSFTATAGNWYRIISSIIGYSGGIITIFGGGPGFNSTTTFSASQTYEDTSSYGDKLIKLSHSVYKGFISKLRAVHNGNYMYIDAYVGNGNGISNLTSVVNGTIGWNILDTIESVNTINGTVYKEITL